MATFGQGINPQLGAIDYSPILRGSLAGAEMAAKGSQMIGQGLANLGQQVGKGIEEYTKKKEERDQLVDGIQSSVKDIGIAYSAWEKNTDKNKGAPPISEAAFQELNKLVANSPNLSVGALRNTYSRVALAGQEARTSQSRNYQLAIQQDALRQIDERKRAEQSMSQIFAPNPSQVQNLIDSGANFNQLGDASPAQAPVGFRDVMQRAAALNIPMSAVLPTLSAMTEQSKVEAGNRPTKRTIQEQTADYLVDALEQRLGRTATSQERGDILQGILQQPNISIGAQEPGTVTTVNPRTGEATVRQVGVNPKAEKERLAKISAGSLLDEVTSDYARLQEMGAIRDSDKSAFANIGSYFSSSKVGQEFGKAIGTQEQVVRDKINQAVPLLIQEFKNATGMTAAQMNSDADVRLVKDAVGNASSDIQVALATMRRLQNRMGVGNNKPNNSAEAIRKEFGL